MQLLASHPASGLRPPGRKGGHATKQAFIEPGLAPLQEAFRRSTPVQLEPSMQGSPHGGDRLVSSPPHGGDRLVSSPPHGGDRLAPGPPHAGDGLAPGPSHDDLDTDHAIDLRVNHSVSVSTTARPNEGQDQLW